jgi:hypothetical protein
VRVKWFRTPRNRGRRNVLAARRVQPYPTSQYGFYAETQGRKGARVTKSVSIRPSKPIRSQTGRRFPLLCVLAPLPLRVGVGSWVDSRSCMAAKVAQASRLHRVWFSHRNKRRPGHSAATAVLRCPAACAWRRFSKRRACRRTGDPQFPGPRSSPTSFPWHCFVESLRGVG